MRNQVNNNRSGRMSGEIKEWLVCERECEKGKRCGCSLVITFMHGEREGERVKGEKKKSERAEEKKVKRKEEKKKARVG